MDSNKQVAYNSGSDACLSSTRATKHDIQYLNLDALAIVSALQPVSFVYNNDVSSTIRYGFIAEDTATIDNHLATHDASGAISGIDRSIIAVLVDAVKLDSKILPSGPSREIVAVNINADTVTAKKIKEMNCAPEIPALPKPNCKRFSIKQDSNPRRRRNQTRKNLHQPLKPKQRLQLPRRATASRHRNATRRGSVEHRRCVRISTARNERYTGYGCQSTTAIIIINVSTKIWMSSTWNFDSRFRSGAVRGLSGRCSWPGKVRGLTGYI